MIIMLYAGMYQHTLLHPGRSRFLRTLSSYNNSQCPPFRSLSSPLFDHTYLSTHNSSSSSSNNLLVQSKVVKLGP